jgi:hypothetical protein
MSQQALIYPDAVGNIENEIYTRDPPKDEGIGDAQSFDIFQTESDSILNETKPYLDALKQTLLLALTTSELSALVGTVSISNLVLILTNGNAFMPFYLTVFLILWALGLFAVSITSALYVKRDIEKCISTILENCFPRS